MHTVQLGARTAYPELSVRRGMRTNAAITAGMATEANRKAGTGERTRELPGETPGSL